MILKQIQKETEEFTDQSIEIVRGFTFNQADTIRRIYHYYNSNYESGDTDSQGNKKYFYNISRNPCNVATKAVDFDTKNINIQTAPGGIPERTWYMERDLKFWMKDQNLGRVLNRLFFELPIFGSVVLKVINGKPYFVDLRNFIVEQSADDLGKANYIIEVHNYTPVEFRKIGKKKKWDKIDETITSFREMDEPYIKVYERYGEAEKMDEEENKSYPFKRIILADVGKDIYDERTKETTPHSGIILAEEEIEEIPYWEFHWEKMPGRWLGIGRVEIIFDPQIRVNEISNQQVKSSYWSTLRLWQTRDEGINRNLLTDVVDGEILNTEEPLNQVDMADRNLAAYNQEINRWLSNRDEVTIAYDVLRGERLPAGTPLGSARLAAGMAGAYFGQIQENIALDVKEFLYKVIIPQFQKENSQEHILRIAGEDLDKLNNLLINTKINKKQIDFVKKNGKLPDKRFVDLQKAIIGERVKQNKEQFVGVSKDFYKNLKYKIDIIITGEALDTRIRAMSLFAALQAVSADPTLLTDPVKKKLFYRYLEQGGISPVDIEPEMPIKGMEELARETGRAGGGISRPALIPGAVPGEVEARI